MANLQINVLDGALEALSHAASFSGALQDSEVVLFGPEVS